MRCPNAREHMKCEPIRIDVQPVNPHRINGHLVNPHRVNGYCATPNFKEETLYDLREHV